MKQLLKLNKKTLKIIYIAIFLSLSILLYNVVKINLSKIVKISLKQTLDYNVEFSGLRFLNLKTIEIKDFQLKNKDAKEIIIESPSLTINLNYRDIFNGYIIENITVNGGYANIQVYDVRKSNILDATVGSDHQINDKAKIVKGLKKIIAKDATVYYSDISYEFPIKKTVESVNGEVNFVGGTSLFFKGYLENTQDQYIYYGLDVANGLQTKLKIQNFTVDSSISQYGKVYKILDISDGVADFDIEFNRKLQLYGSGKVTNFTAVYKPSNLEVKNGTAELLFHDKYIEINAVGDFLDSKIEANVVKIENNITTELKGKNINLRDFSNTIEEYNKKGKSIKIPKLEGVVSYFTLNLKADENNLEKITADGFIKGNEIEINSKNRISDFSGEFMFKNNIFAFDNLKFRANINQISDFPIDADFRLAGVYEGNKSIVNYSLKNINTFAHFDDLTGSIKYDFDNEYITINNDTESLKGTMSYERKSGLEVDLKVSDYKLNYKGQDLYSFNGDFKLKYDFKNKKFKETNINTEIVSQTYFDTFQAKLVDDNGSLKFDDISIKKNKSYMEFSGYLNLSEISYEILLVDAFVENKDLDNLQNINKLELNFDGHLNGDIRGNSQKLNADINLIGNANDENFSAKELKSKITFMYDFTDSDTPISVESKSSLKYFDYGEIFFQDLVLDITYFDNVFKLNRVYNNLLTISGEYNIINSVFFVDYKLKNYSLERIPTFANNKITGEIETFSGRLKGTSRDYKLIFNLDDSYVKYNDGKATYLKGKAEYYNDSLELTDVQVNKNLINGIVDFESEKLDLKIKFFENEFNKYYNYPDLKYRIIGELNIWGPWEDVKGIAAINLDKIYFRGESIPDLTFELSYNSGQLDGIMSEGLISLNELVVHNDKGKKISGIEGYYNLDSKEFKLTLKKEALAIEDLSYLASSEDIKGDLKLDFEIEGILDREIKYRLLLENDGIDYRNVHVDNFSFLIVGTDEKVKLEYLNFEYGENQLKGYGSVDYSDNSYTLKLKGEEIDLVFLNVLELDLLEEINGLVSIDIDVNEQKNSGFIEIKDLNLRDKSKRINLKSFEGKIEFQQDTFTAKQLEGEFNDGKLSIDGYWKIPKFSLKLLKSPRLLLSDYSLRILADDLNYYTDFMNLSLDSELELSPDFVKGELIVNSGEIYKLPSLANNTTEEEAKRDIYLEKISMDLDITVRNDLVVRIEELSEDFSFVKDLELNIEGNGTVTIDNGQINFIGSFDSDNGALSFNNTLLSIESASVIFEDKNDYFPNVNPYVTLNSETEVSGEDIYVAISGYYKSLQLRLSSKSGLSEQDISSLLLFQKTFDDTETSEVVREILDTQLSSTIFSPISNEMEKLFGISNISISSKLLTQNQGDAYSVTDNLILGAVFESSDPIYKDKVFWNMKTEFSETESGKMDNFDLWISYKINNNTSWKTGVKRDSELENDVLDVHLDLDFKYKVDSFFSILEYITK